LKQRTRKINNKTIAQFQLLLENATWAPVLKNKHTNYEFNSFLYIFLNVFEASFPIQNNSTDRLKKILEYVRKNDLANIK
jgi:hypothetical protein